MLSRIRSWLDSAHSENSDIVERVPQQWTACAILLASACGLYLELVMIRWHATSSHVFAIFKNVSMLSCFLGLGIGYMLSKKERRISLAAFLPMLALQVFILGLISTTIGGRRINPVAEQLVMGLPSDEWNILHAIEGNATLAAVFLLNAVMFIPWGYITGRLMRRLSPTQGYSLNLLGSLAGIAVFFLFSLAWAPPPIWFGVVVLGSLPFINFSPRVNRVSVVSVAVIGVSLAMVGRLEERRYYSPYQVITLRLPKGADTPPVPTIKVNHSFYQAVYDCSPMAVSRFPELRAIADYYDLPYHLRSTPGDVLVVGAGSGNDVAAALRNGASSVTAVEIDPAIQYLGRRLHPESPYKDPRTTAILNDARSHLRQTNDKYDTVIYGLLDSHTNLGAMTNVRLDSFVYTVEGFREAIARLSPRGLVFVSYLVLDPKQANKLYAMLGEAYPDSKPRVFTSECGLTYVTGPGLCDLKLADSANITEQTEAFSSVASEAEVATDDWPYFYMQERTYPVTYAIMVALLFGLSVWLVRSRVGMPSVNPVSGIYFFLGTGFMLIETKVITELGLVFGNTWMVSGIAIGGILLMAYAANLWVDRRGELNQAVLFSCLAVALVLGYTISRLSSQGLVLPLEKVSLPIVLLLPLLFAGLIFSSNLRRTQDLGEALSANLFGAMLGGFLEYNSMYWGLASLYVMGLAIYSLAYGCLRLSRAGVTHVDPGYLMQPVAK